jgi:hypothetical protein
MVEGQLLLTKRLTITYITSEIDSSKLDIYFTVASYIACYFVKESKSLTTK